MRPGLLLLLVLLSAILAAAPAPSAHAIEEDARSMPDPAGTDPEPPETEPPRGADGAAGLFRINGYLESENFIMYGKNLKTAEYAYLSGILLRLPRNERLFNKIEAHAALDLRVGTDDLHARAFVHGYAYPQKNGTGHLDSRVLPNELYIRWLTPHLNMVIGRQVIRWGTADMMNPTAHFAPLDLSELLFKDDDELYLGVHALSTTLILGDFSLQLVCAPIATWTILPDPSGPWSLQFPNSRHLVPVHYVKRKPSLRPNGANISYGGRFAGTAGPVDFSLSAYRGVDRDVLFQPFVDPGGPIPTAYVLPKYRRLTSFGFDLAVPVGDFTLQAEAAYSFDKHAVEEPSAAGLIRAPISPTHYLNFAAGFNWLIDGEDFNITMEFNKSIYLVDGDKYIDPYLSDMFACRIEKRFFQSRLLLRAQGVVTLRRDFLAMPALGFDFRNGLSMEAEGGIFGGPAKALFGSYRSRDIVRIRVKYQF